jgi:hypothetical protein
MPQELGVPVLTLGVLSQEPFEVYHDATTTSPL